MPGAHHIAIVHHIEELPELVGTYGGIVHQQGILRHGIRQGHTHVQARLQHPIGILQLGTEAHGTRRETKIRRQVIELALPSLRAVRTYLQGHEVVGFRNLGLRIPQQLERQVLVIRDVEIRIHLVVLIHRGELHRRARPTDVASIGILRQVRYSIDGRPHVTIAQVDLRGLQFGLGIAYLRLATLHIGLRLDELDSAHGIALDGLLHAFVIALRINQIRLRVFQIRLRLFHGILVQGRVDDEEYLPLLHRLAGRIFLGQQRTVHTTHDVDTRFRSEIPRIIPSQGHILYDRLGHLHGQGLHTHRGFFLATSGYEQGGQGDDVYCLFHN